MPAGSLNPNTARLTADTLPSVKRARRSTIFAMNTVLNSARAGDDFGSSSAPTEVADK